MKLLLLSLLALAPAAWAQTPALHRGHHPVAAVPAVPGSGEKPTIEQTLPPLPEDVSQLLFSEIFKMPFGAYGPEFTDKARSLDGKKVRLLGYMVREDTSPDNCNPNLPRRGPSWISSVIPGRMMLAPERVQVSMSHYALCDDLPMQTVFVTVPDCFGELVPYYPKPLLLTGTLSIGNKPEPDGRISTVRLVLDATSEQPAGEKISSTALQANNTQTKP